MFSRKLLQQTAKSKSRLSGKLNLRKAQEEQEERVYSRRVPRFECGNMSHPIVARDQPLRVRASDMRLNPERLGHLTEQRFIWGIFGEMPRTRCMPLATAASNYC